MTPERQLEDHLIETLRGLKYEYRADIRYVRGLKAGEGLDEAAIRAGYQRFKDEKHAAEFKGVISRGCVRMKNKQPKAAKRKPSNNEAVRRRPSGDR